MVGKHPYLNPGSTNYLHSLQICISLEDRLVSFLMLFCLLLCNCVFSLQPHKNHPEEIYSFPNWEHIEHGWPQSNCFLICLQLRFYVTWTTSKLITYCHSWTFCPSSFICPGTTWSNYFVRIDQKAVTKRSGCYRCVHRVIVWSPDGGRLPAGNVNQSCSLRSVTQEHIVG